MQDDDGRAVAWNSDICANDGEISLSRLERSGAGGGTVDGVNGKSHLGAVALEATGDGFHQLRVCAALRTNRYD